MKHTHGGYGNFPGGDPRRFTPDSEESGTTPAEMAAWKEACRLANEAEAKGETHSEAGSCLHAGAAIITMSRFGLGGYEYDCDDPGCPEGREEWQRDQADGDPDDAFAGFTAWWSWDGQVAAGDRAPDFADIAREAFVAGWKAAVERQAKPDDEGPF